MSLRRPRTSTARRRPRGDRSRLGATPGETRDLYSEERELVSRASQGDESAFRTLVERHHAVVCALARWKLRDAILSQEIAQEVFMRLFRSLRRFRFDSSLRTWLSRVTLNLCNDHLRRRQREARVRASSGNTREAMPPAREPSPEAALLARETEATLHEALRELPEDLREVVLLRYAGDLSYTEISAALGWPLGTVCTRLARAVKLLAERLRKEAARG